MKRNRARCKNCNTVIESRYRHDFVTCRCYQATGIDANNFIKRLVEMIKDNTNLEDETVNTIKHLAGGIYHELFGHGFFLDGGPSVEGEYGYQRYGGKIEDISWIGDEEDVS